MRKGTVVGYNIRFSLHLFRLQNVHAHQKTRSTLKQLKLQICSLSFFGICSKYRDVKQALQYVDDNAVKVIADAFFQVHGQDVFPLSHTATLQQLNAVRDQLQRNVRED